MCKFRVDFGPYFGHFSSPFAPQDVEKNMLKISQFLNCFLVSFWVPFWYPFGAQMGPTWAAWAPCGALEVPWGVRGRPRETQELISDDFGSHFGSFSGT